MSDKSRLIRVPKSQALLNRLAALTMALVMVAAMLSALTSAGCTSAPTTNGNSNSNANSNANINSNANSNSSTTGAALTTTEPERYSTTMTISGTGTFNQRQGSMPPLQFDFAKMGTDRRWSFKLPAPVGEVIYLEKAGLKYLIIPARNQYVEMSPEQLGFQLGNLMTPITMIDQLKARTQHENLGTETVDGRAAVKYRFAGARDTRTQAGTVQADSFVWVDQSTGLPIRSDINISTTSGETARIATETRDIQLNPDPAQFDVPAGMRKVTGEELKQQVQGFIQAIQFFVQMMRAQQVGAAPAATPAVTQPPAANSNQAATNANR